MLSEGGGGGVSEGGVGSWDGLLGFGRWVFVLRISLEEGSTRVSLEEDLVVDGMARSVVVVVGSGKFESWPVGRAARRVVVLSDRLISRRVTGEPG